MTTDSLLDELDDEAQRRRVQRVAWAAAILLTAVVVALSPFLPVGVFTIFPGLTHQQFVAGLFASMGLAIMPLLAWQAWMRFRRRGVQQASLPERPSVPVWPQRVLGTLSLCLLLAVVNGPTQWLWVLLPATVVGVGLWAAASGRAEGVAHANLRGASIAGQAGATLAMGVLLPDAMLPTLVLTTGLLWFVATRPKSLRLLGDYEGAKQRLMAPWIEAWSTAEGRAILAAEAHADDAEPELLLASRGPHFVAMTTQLAWWREHRGDPQGADRAALAALRDRPDLSAGYLARGMLCIWRDQDATPWTERAMQRAHREFPMPPNLGLIYGAHAVALARKGGTEEARELMARVRPPKNHSSVAAGCSYLLGVAAEALGEDPTSHFELAATDTGFWGQLTARHPRRHSK